MSASLVNYFVAKLYTHYKVVIRTPTKRPPLAATRRCRSVPRRPRTPHSPPARTPPRSHQMSRPHPPPSRLPRTPKRFSSPWRSRTRASSSRASYDTLPSTSSSTRLPIRSRARRRRRSRLKPRVRAAAWPCASSMRVGVSCQSFFQRAHRAQNHSRVVRTRRLPPRTIPIDA